MHEFNGSHDFGTLRRLRDAQVVQFCLVQVVEVFQFLIAIEHENGEMFLKEKEEVILTYFHTNHKLNMSLVVLARRGG